MGIKGKGKSLKLIFLEYLLSIGIALVLSVGLAILTLNSLFLMGQIIPSNYTEKLIFKNKTKIANEEFFDENLIPRDATYLFLSKNGNVLKSNMNDTQRNKAIQFHNREEVSTSFSYYIEINRKDGDVVINYTLQPYYTNYWVARHFPSVNILFASILILFCLLSSLVITLIWAKKLTKQLSPIIKASEKIAKQDLDFEMGYSNVKEFNIVLRGLEDMKVALSESLKDGWLQEENRRNQISALTHDLKTPISIVQGNAQLLKKTDMTEEQNSYVEYILKNSNRISDYTHALMIMNKTDNLNEISLEKVDCIEVTDIIFELAKEVCLINNLNLNSKITVDDNLTMLVDITLLERVIYNVLSNASEYTPTKSTIDLQIESNLDTLTIRIMDQGSGFTENDLLHVQEQFYRGDKSRHSAKNYGLGLYTTSQIMKLHGGELKLENRTDQNGAIAILKFPLK